jgi:hypothetical protein
VGLTDDEHVFVAKAYGGDRTHPHAGLSGRDADLDRAVDSGSDLHRGLVAAGRELLL